MTKKINLSMIIMLYIIFSISIINNNRDMIMEKQIIKGMDESAQVKELNSQITQLNTAHTDYMNYIQECKTQIATELTNEGVSTSSDDLLETMATNISKIVQAKTSTATATTEDIAEGKTAWVNGVEIIGTKQDNSLIYIGNSENSTYDLTSIDGYENFTIENFCIKNFNQTVKVIKSGPVYATTATTNPLSYNSTTGILTAKSSIGPNQHQHLEFSCTYDIYLQK